MATQHRSANAVLASNPDFRHQQLLALIARLCPPRHLRPAPDECRLIVDSRLDWDFAPVDGHTSWIYLPQVAHAKMMAGCLVLTAR